jgi:hypothetical protein
VLPALRIARLERVARRAKLVDHASSMAEAARGLRGSGSCPWAAILGHVRVMVAVAGASVSASDGPCAPRRRPIELRSPSPVGGQWPGEATADSVPTNATGREGTRDRARRRSSSCTVSGTALLARSSSRLARAGSGSGAFKAREKRSFVFSSGRRWNRDARGAR